MEKHEPQPIIFFDGVCGLCNRSVDFIIRHDKKKKFRFASLQGSTAKTMIDPAFINDLQTFVFCDNGKIYTKSTAALRVFRKLNGIFTICILFFIIPKRIRDFLYNVIAKHRYQWFGGKETCRIPSPDERKYFLP